MKRVGDRKSLLSLVELQQQAIHENDKQMVQKMVGVVQEVSGLLERFDFNHAAQRLYDFAWHEYADVYIEDVKNRMDENASAVADSLYAILLQLLHPFMPFVTEEIYQKIPGHTESIMISSWPVAGDAK
jgi:valyl-tRNA synthetase